MPHYAKEESYYLAERGQRSVCSQPETIVPIHDQMTQAAALTTPANGSSLSSDVARVESQ